MTYILLTSLIFIALICTATINACIREKRYIHSAFVSLGGVFCVAAVVGMVA